MSDTLTALQTALSPKTGMQRIPFPLESYEHPSLPLVAKRLVNLMAEKQPADARTTAALVSTPGLVPYTPIGTGPILAMNDDVPGAIYIVSGTEAFRMSFDPLVAIRHSRASAMSALRTRAPARGTALSPSPPDPRPSLSAQHPTPIPAAICPASC